MKNKIRSNSRSPEGLTPSELVIAKAPIPQLVNEYNLIQKKESKLSAHLRKVVEIRIRFLIKEGVIINENLKHAKK